MSSERGDGALGERGGNLMSAGGLLGEERDGVAAAERLHVHEREVLEERRVRSRHHVLEQRASGSRYDVSNTAMSLPGAPDERQYVGAGEASELLKFVDCDDDVTLEGLRHSFGNIETQACEVVGHVGASQ